MRAPRRSTHPRAVAASLGLALLAAAPAWGQEAGAQLEAALAAGALAALDGDAKAAVRELSHAALMAPERPEIQDLLALAALVTGDRARAVRLCAGRPGLALYHAMAVSIGPGGAGRAREILAGRAKDDDAPASVLFLAALAFANAGDEARAHDLLARAVEGAPSALDPAFAPDPGAELVERTVDLLARLGDSPGRSLELGKKLVEKGHRRAAVTVAARLAEVPSAKAAARRLRATALERSEPRRALEELDALLGEGEASARGVDLEEVALKKLELSLAVGELDAARRSLGAAEAVKEGLRPRLARARARLLLEAGGDPKAALEAAETAASLDPRSSSALWLLARAQLANGRADRAAVYASQLLERHPRELDAYALLASIAQAKRDAGKARAHRLRSDAFRAERARIEQEVGRREAVLRAVRDAERGLGIAALAAVRAEEPTLALPVDLATARSGTAGFKRQARERILAACRGELAVLLERTSGWDRLATTSALYGAAEPHEAPLSAADPGRCSDPGLRTRPPKRR